MVHGSADAIFTADLMNRIDLPGVEEDAFRKCRFAAVNVGRDADIPDPVHRNFSRNNRKESNLWPNPGAFRP